MIALSLKWFVVRLGAAVGAVTAVVTLAAAPEDIFFPRTGLATESLNGAWQFKYIPGAEIGADASFREVTFAGAAAWKTLPVPAHWELHGFAEPKYAKVDEGTGLYRRTFRVSPGWAGQRVFLRFEGVLYGFEAWVNGRSVGSWGSAYNPVTFDITDALKPDGDNLLAVQVTTRNLGWEFDTNDCWALSGIYRDVTLFAAPAIHLKDLTTNTTLSSDGTAALRVDLAASGAGNWTGRLLSPAGKVVQEFPIALNAEHRGSATVVIASPQLWTAETPWLYRLELSLQADGGQRQNLSEKIGLRQMTIEDGVLKLNGTAIKLRGVDHHDLWPVAGRVATEELMRRDLALIQAANINFIRTSHYPPHPRLIELCDELGIYVMDEVPFGFGDAHLKDPAYQDTLLTRARATVLRDKNRPSVIVWSVGNENPNTPLTFATGQRVKELDPTRPICFPQVGSYFERSHAELPDWVDIYAPHYPVVKTVQRYATELKRPIIVTEYAHALGLASDRIQDEWDIMQANPRFAGGAIWMFQDQGILRTAEKPTDLATPSLYAWPDATHYYDTSGNAGMDGIVYSDRTPQTDYLEVRNVYSPVQIAERILPAKSGAQSVTLHVENRFDFRSLAGFKLTWELQKNWKFVKKGSIALTTKPHATDALSLAVKLPDDFGNDYYVLSLHCLNERGESMYERAIRLETPAKDAMQANLFASLKSAGLELTESPEEIRVTHPRFTVNLNRRTGALSLRNRSGETLAEGGYPHVGRRFTEAEALRAKTASLWTGAFLHDPTNLETEATRTAAGIRLRIRGKYPRNQTPEQFLEGEQSLLVRPNGAIDVTYDYTPLNATGALLEAGLSFVSPASASEFRWLGEGPLPGYPGKDRLNNFGVHHLNRGDLNFSGNRREVSFAMLTRQNGVGILLAADSARRADIAVEAISDGTLFSHNSILSGRGNKGVGPETVVKAEDVKRISGNFILLPLGADWPAPVARWFGKPGQKVPVFQPFFRSYDQ